jgi:hypothetical protein
MVLGVAIGALSVASCSTETTEVPGEFCIGGLELEDGSCVPKCDPSKCGDGNTCVANFCRLKCEAHSECYPESQRCAGAKEDDSDADVKVCLDGGQTRLFDWIGVCT